MEVMTLIIICVILCVTFVIFIKKKDLNLPGPKTFPIVGNLHQLNSKKLHIQLLEWAKVYGPIYHIWFGHKPVIVVTGTKQIHEVLGLKNKDFSGRTHSFIMQERTCGGKAVTFGDPSPEWKVQKKLFLSTFKSYGLGTKRIEKLSVRYIKEWIEMVKNQYDDKNGLDLKEPLVDVMYRMIDAIALHDSLHTEENIARIKELVKLDYTIFARCMQFQGFLLDRSPILRFFRLPLYRDVQTLNSKLRELFSDIKRKELDLMENARKDTGNVLQCTLISKFLEYQLGNNNVKLDDDRIMWPLFEAYTAGTATTSTNFLFLFNMLAQNRDIQRKIQAEIDNVLGTADSNLEDRERMPYTQATLLEMLRLSSINPVLIPHRTIKDTSIDGHLIPKDTEVWINSWGHYHDDAVWNKPFQFMPERFLDSSGNLLPPDHPNRKNHLLFGAGQRVCAGETLAPSRMFLILTMFLQKFSVLPFSADQPSYDTRDLDMGFILTPLPYKVKLELR